MKLYVGTNAIRHEWYSPVCASAAYLPRNEGKVRPEEVLLDSGAFTDGMSKKPRLCAEEAALRQLRWQGKAQGLWGNDFRADKIVAYDALARTAHDRATIRSVIEETYRNNLWLDAHRSWFPQQTLIFPLQGNGPSSFVMSAARTMPILRPRDWCGLGGW